MKLQVNTLIIALLFSAAFAGPVAADFDAKNICSVFRQHPSWKKAAFKAERKWGTRVETAMAVVFYESSYRRNVRPKKEKRVLFWKVKRNDGTSLGFAQATRETWGQYKKETGRPFAKRKSFYDNMDFIGWYNSKSRKVLKLKPNDVFSYYIAYHEGWSGYKTKKWRRKPIAKRAKQVADLADRYSDQLVKCSWQRRREQAKTKRR